MTEVRVAIQDDLLAAIDAEAARRSLTREMFLVEAARRAVAGAAVGPEVELSDPLMW
jgi:hypothetical protein